MAEKRVDRCETCKFWEREVGFGKCHRYPPHGGVMDFTAADEWCGEWQKKEKYEWFEKEAK